MQARTRRRMWISGGLLVAAMILLLWRLVGVGARAPRGSERRAAAAAPARIDDSREWEPPLRWRRAGASAPDAGVAAGEGDPRRLHLVDPCAPRTEPQPPPGYERASHDGITIHWDGESLSPGEAEELLDLADTLLEEAALLTTTPRRRDLGIVIYASRDAFAGDVQVPVWAGGAYDGLVRVFRDGKPLSRSALRHEILHAQVDSQVGCVPFWFNEGLAEHFEQSSWRAERTWISLLRQRTWIPFDALGDGAVELPDAASAHRAYGQSLAMVTWLLERDGELGVTRAIGLLRKGTQPGELWAALELGNEEDLRTYLADRSLGLPLGAELDQILAAPVCCPFGRKADRRCRASPEVHVPAGRSFRIQRAHPSSPESPLELCFAPGPD